MLTLKDSPRTSVAAMLAVVVGLAIAHVDSAPDEVIELERRNGNAINYTYGRWVYDYVRIDKNQRAFKIANEGVKGTVIGRYYINGSQYAPEGGRYFLNWRRDPPRGGEGGVPADRVRLIPLTLQDFESEYLYGIYVIQQAVEGNRCEDRTAIGTARNPIGIIAGYFSGGSSENIFVTFRQRLEPFKIDLFPSCTRRYINRPPRCFQRRENFESDEEYGNYVYRNAVGRVNIVAGYHEGNERLAGKVAYTSYAPTTNKKWIYFDRDIRARDITLIL